MLALSTQRQLLTVTRSVVYAQKKRLHKDLSEFDLLLLQLLDEEYTRHTFYGSLRMTKYLHDCARAVNRKRVRCLMQTLGLAGMAPVLIPASRTRSTKFISPGSEASISTDPIRCGALTLLTLDLPRGFVYLVAIIDC